MKKYSSKLEKIIEQLKAEGKVYTLSDEEMSSVNKHIAKDMENFRRDLYKKFKASEQDLHNIILNA